MAESEKLAELLLRWEELRQQGGNPSARELCSDCPQLAEQLEQRIRVMQKMEGVLGIATTVRGGRSSILEKIPLGPAQQTLPLPTIPDYEILGVLGRGGMGVVYHARQLKLGRIVAVKMLDVATIGTQQLERFFEEARSVASLHHPNVVQIYDFGQAQNVPFFSMEFVDGGNLKELIGNGPLIIENALRMMEIISRAVHSVHREGFVHRDLKPANILLTQDGQPKVTDFGLVKRFDEEAGNTKSGEILGTIGYMAPEQLDRRHAKIGPCTDVYALGAILYEMLTGEPAFDSNPALVLRQVLQDDVTLPTRIRPSVPRDVEAICLKCLEKDVSDRYASAEALAEDLRRFAEHRPITARRLGIVRRSIKWTRRRPYVAILILVVAAICVSWPLMTMLAERRVRNARRALAIQVAPLAREILHRNCYACHGGDPRNIRKQFDVLDHELLLDSDRRIVVPGDPDNSRLVQRIKDGSMPPEELETSLPRLAEQELVILNQWILGGAPRFPVEDSLHPTPPVVAASPIAAAAKRIFRIHCYECHSYDVAEGGIKILHHRLLLQVRKVVVPGQPNESELFRLLVSDDNETVMPPPPHQRLDESEVDIIRDWIESGASPFPKTSDQSL